MSETSSEQSPSEDQSVHPSEREVSDEEQKEIEQDREERLDPDNRPDMAEVDNTDRDFDPVAGQFTDQEDDGLGPFADPSEEV